MSRERRFIVVSNRLPVTLERTEREFRVQPSGGGLVSALQPLMRDRDACWIGWTGAPDTADLPGHLWNEIPGTCSLVPVSLTADEKTWYYQGCCNEIIWPLFHELPSRCKFDPVYWEVYRDVTEKFADSVEQTARRDDFVWVHDYHLMMLADALRARDLRLNLAYFHHIPFPPPDIFEKLPWRTEILHGLLQFDTIGFQTVRDRRNFVASLRRCLREVHLKRLVGEKVLVRAQGLSTVAGAFPISIDFQEFATLARNPDIAANSAEIRRSLGEGHLVLGVDRLDYTKGISERLCAFRRLLEQRSDLRGRVTLLQVVVPSREDIPSYRELKLEIERLVSAINTEYSQLGWTPVVYLHRCLTRAELIAFYRAADVALVTPLKDGMNLVAKEFCASRIDEQGVLVLSEFAGSATELGGGALLVNPYDSERMALALDRALRMSDGEQRARMLSMRQVLQRNDVFRWCDAICASANVSRARQRPTSLPTLSVPPLQAQVAAGF